MTATKADIIAQLKRDIIPLHAFKSNAFKPIVDIELGLINQAFPNAQFPVAAVHEFVVSKSEDAASTSGFICGVLAALVQNKGATIWISPYRIIFPPALQSFVVSPQKIIFIHLKKEKERLWAMEEALKCNGLAAVIAEIPELSFTASRRLQLAVEKSQVTGFILRQNPRALNITACTTRWKITSLASGLPGKMPGVGFPRWNVELLKVRNGSTGNWQIEFIAGRFRHITPIAALTPLLKKKTG
jgi:protein ImuA